MYEEMAESSLDWEAATTAASRGATGFISDDQREADGRVA